MSEKKRKKQQPVTKRDGPRPEDQPSETKRDDGEEKEMDFGGLPNRDLKKNLGGCG